MMRDGNGGKIVAGSAVRILFMTNKPLDFGVVVKNNHSICAVFYRQNWHLEGWFMCQCHVTNLPLVLFYKIQTALAMKHALVLCFLLGFQNVFGQFEESNLYLGAKGGYLNIENYYPRYYAGVSLEWQINDHWSLNYNIEEDFQIGEFEVK